jgi:hypothetical protein
MTVVMQMYSLTVAGAAPELSLDVVSKQTHRLPSSRPLARAITLKVRAR